MTEALRINSTAGADDVQLLAKRAMALVGKVKKMATSPETTKVLRQFSTGEASEVTGIPVATLKRKATSGAYPAGTVNSQNGHRSFSLKDILDIMDIEELRKPYCRAIVVAIANFKGGVAKTTTAIHYAQYEALRGSRVLIVDFDPQGSATSSMGLIPDSDVGEHQTARDFLQGDSPSLKVQKTYWPNIDLIPANLSLYAAEFELPKRAEREGPGASSVSVLDAGLEALKDQYDVIVIDTPPALSYLTTNAIYAADGVIVPVQANMLDFTSCSQFLRLLSETVSDFEGISGSSKKWQFLRFLVTRFGGTDSEQAIVEWMQTIFGERTIRYPLSNTGAIQAAGPEMVSIYEADPRHPDPDRRIDRRTYKRALNILNPAMGEISDTVRDAEQKIAKELTDQLEAV
jgi:chromosome partitioning protein